MFGSSVRGGGAGRFVPRLEALGVRANPGGVSGGVLRGSATGSAIVAQEQHIGEEIPQTIAAFPTNVQLDAAKLRMASGSNAGVLTEIPAHGVWVGGDNPHGVEVSPLGGVSGGVL